MIGPGFDIKQLHGDITQSARTQTLEDFRSGRFKIIIATDVAARGLDISGVELVINIRVSSYVHMKKIKNLFTFSYLF